MTSIWHIIYIGGVFMALFLFILLISKPKKSAADMILSTWLFFAFFDLILVGLYGSGEILKMPKLFGWEMLFPYLHGPFLYLYILFATGQQRHTWRYLLHFIPAVIVAVILAFVLPDAVAEYKGKYYMLREYDTFIWIMMLGFMISGIVYIILSLMLLRRHRQNIVGQFSNTEKITLNWIRYLIFGIGAIWIVVIIEGSPELFFVVITLFIFFFGYFGVQQVGIFSHASSVHEVVPLRELEAVDEIRYDEATPEPAEKVKYEKTRLEESEASLIHGKLNALMKEQKCYQDPELTLGDLAKILEVHPVILSQVINSREQKSFYDYVNTYRVETFKELLLRPDSRQYTMLSLAFECGFNSKTSFNRNFKKITQMSPSAYAKGLDVQLKTEG
ncbi:helix-turn-helix domain-containing protein [Sphingobacterium thalpophilum]|uniref:Helix-turn-helix domain-containing protein n=1 Tax=Sphingobacterium thalpophilum TaxID=259 RepID=A0ABV4HJM3_9SPHI